MTLPRSLRLRLVVSLAAAAAVVLLGAVALSYQLISHGAWAQFDESLTSKAVSLAAMTEWTEEGLESELGEAPPKVLEQVERGDLFQIWRPDGSILLRSVALGAAELISQPAAIENETRIQPLTLPGGQPGRAVVHAYHPRIEPEARGAVDARPACIVVARPTHGVTAMLSQLRNGLIAAALGAAGLSALLAALIVRRCLTPLSALSSGIAEIGDRDLTCRIRLADAPAELQPIVLRLNELLARLEDAFRRERQFTGDVAHELRTPLAGLRAQLELALSRERSPTEYAATAQRCLGVTLEMQRLVEALLGLARADAGQLEVRSEPLNLWEAVRQSWHSLDARAAERRLRVEWQRETDRPIRSDPGLLGIVLQNVLGNAVEHADAGGRVRIRALRENGHDTLQVENTGCVLSHDRARQVFDRFWRGDGDQRGADGHAGLGLSLCRAIVHRLGGSIDAEVPSIGEFRIVLRLPAKD